MKLQKKKQFGYIWFDFQHVNRTFSTPSTRFRLFARLSAFLYVLRFRSVWGKLIYTKFYSEFYQGLVIEASCNGVHVGLYHDYEQALADAPARLERMKRFSVKYRNALCL